MTTQTFPFARKSAIDEHHDSDEELKKSRMVGYSNTFFSLFFTHHATG